MSQSFQVPAGTLDSATLKHESSFVNTDYHETVLSQMIQSHLVKDFCVIGVRDMTSRDLLQQRSTLPNGDMVWGPSPLVTAALEGSLAVLDGVHRVNAGSFSVFHRSVLCDGIAVAEKHEVSRLYSGNKIRSVQL
ncbi:hypothetical protein BsWGS_16785 [Bradybaena similaris]